MASKWTPSRHSSSSLNSAAHTIRNETLSLRSDSPVRQGSRCSGSLSRGLSGTQLTVYLPIRVADTDHDCVIFFSAERVFIQSLSCWLIEVLLPGAPVSFFASRFSCITAQSKLPLGFSRLTFTTAIFSKICSLTRG